MISVASMKMAQGSNATEPTCAACAVKTKNISTMRKGSSPIVAGTSMNGQRSAKAAP